VLTVPRAAVAILALMDGTRTVADIQADIMRRHGQLVAQDQLQGIVDTLDHHLFLEGERLELERSARAEAFRASPVRPAVHAGKAYAGEGPALTSQMDGFFRHPEGPGPPGPRGAPVLRGLIAPHIDFHRGGSTYAWAYQEVLARSDADLYVVLGTCHAGMADPFAVTLKPFETPLGAVPVDREFYEALRRRAGQDLLASEPAHRAEHSIEFQAVMLRHLLGPRRPFAILPVLASYLHEAVWTRGEPEADERVPRFVDALRETIAASSQRVCLIAGVDLAHVGPRFGDPEPNTDRSLGAVERADRSMLESVLAGDARGFFASVASDRDARRICGLSPIYTLLRLLSEAPGRLLRYTQWPDPEGAVTFCAATFP
jgi:hypothetical protein